MADVTRYTVDPACDGSVMPYAGGGLVLARDHDRVVRWFRAKVMRERAGAHERCAWLIGLGSILSPFAFPEPRHQQLLVRARRLRAKADRVEKGTP